MTRDEILTTLKEQHAELASILAGVPADAMTKQPIVEWWSVKDLMGHITLWQHVAIKFIREYQQDGAPKMPGIKDDAALDAYNKRGAALRRDWTVERVRAEFDAACHDLVAAVESLSDADLSKVVETLHATSLQPPWDADATLERLIAVNSYQHIPEHIEQISHWQQERAAKH